MKKRVLALMLVGAFAMQSVAALGAELDISEEIIEADIVIADDSAEDETLTVDENTASAEDEEVVGNEVQSITVEDQTGEEASEEPTMIVERTKISGTALYWSLDSAGTLSITGSGKIPNYTSSNPPWWHSTKKYQDMIKLIVLSEKVTQIGTSAFYGCKNLETINIPASVVTIGKKAFWTDKSLKDITINNPECEILEDNVNPTIPTGTVHGYPNSTAQAYVERHQGEDKYKGLVFDCLHSWGEGTVTVKATCDTDGVMTYTCACGATKTEPIPAGHDWDDGEVTKEPTCSAEGEKTYTCNDCEKTKTEAIPVDPDKHAWDDGEVTKEPTCSAEGEKTYTCKDCEKTKTEAIPVDPDKHAWDDWGVTTPATCEENGEETRICKNNTAHTETREITATGHKWGEWEVTTPATCEKAGVETRICKNNSSHTETRSIEATGHKWDSGTVTTPATCNKAGVKTYKCTNDGCTKTYTETIPATGNHTYETIITKAKPGADGSIVEKCAVCGKVKSKTAIAAPKTVTLSSDTYTYTGSAKKPTVKVEDSAGKTISSSNYTVQYASGRTLVGSYKVTVTFKGSKYTGSKSAVFRITPKKTTLKSVTAAKKAFTVKWNKQSPQTTGYQIRYSTSSKFTNATTVTVKGSSTLSKKISKVSAKKKYYVKVRTYKTVNGRRYYSGWSSVKTVTTKK